MKKWAVFVDYCDAGQMIFDSYEEAISYYNYLCARENDDINIYLCEVIKNR